MQTPVFSGRVLFATILGAPIIWSLQFVAVWGLSEFLCRIGVNVTLFGFNVIHLVTLAFSIVAVVLMLFVGFTSLSLVQHANAIEEDEDSEAQREVERTRFIAQLGMGFSALFGLVSVYLIAPILAVPVC